MTSEEPLNNTDTIALLTEIGNYERHFNNVQSIYRGIASTWLLASFGAIGFILFNKDAPHGLPCELLIAYVALFASIGLLLLWNLDINVYQRLLVACFETGMTLNALPNPRTYMAKASSSVFYGLLSFYSFAILSQIVIALRFIWQPESAKNPVEFNFALALVLMIFAATVCMAGFTHKISKAKYP